MSIIQKDNVPVITTCPKNHTRRNRIVAAAVVVGALAYGVYTVTKEHTQEDTEEN